MTRNGYPGHTEDNNMKFDERREKLKIKLALLLVSSHWNWNVDSNCLIHSAVIYGNSRCTDLLFSIFGYSIPAAAAPFSLDLGCPLHYFPEWSVWTFSCYLTHKNSTVGKREVFAALAMRFRAITMLNIWSLQPRTWRRCLFIRSFSGRFQFSTIRKPLKDWHAIKKLGILMSGKYTTSFPPCRRLFIRRHLNGESQLFIIFIAIAWAARMDFC